MSTTRRRGLLLAAVLTLVVIATSGAALAYWRSTGSGSGSGATGTTTSITLTPGTAAASLYPGASADVVLTASNPNTSPVRIGSLALDTTQGIGGFAVDAGHSACAVSALSLPTQTNGGAGWTVPGKVGAVNGSLSITLTSAVTMSATAANACQGATFAVYLTAGP